MAADCRGASAYVPVGLYWKMLRLPVSVPMWFRVKALIIGGLCPGLSYLLFAFGSYSSRHVLREFSAVRFLEGTMDMWPCLIMLLCVRSMKERGAETRLPVTAAGAGAATAR